MHAYIHTYIVYYNLDVDDDLSWDVFNNMPFIESGEKSSSWKEDLKAPQKKQCWQICLKDIPIQHSMGRTGWIYRSMNGWFLWDINVGKYTTSPMDSMGYMDVSKNRGKKPKWMVKRMENLMNKWMIWVFSHYFWKHPYKVYIGLIIKGAPHPKGTNGTFMVNVGKYMSQGLNSLYWGWSSNL